MFEKQCVEDFKTSKPTKPWKETKGNNYTRGLCEEVPFYLIAIWRQRKNKNTRQKIPECFSLLTLRFKQHVQRHPKHIYLEVSPNE